MSDIVEAKKILFVFPETRYPSGQPPLGIGYLSSIARNMGHETVLCDMSFMKEPLSKLKSMISRIKPDIVGVSVLTPQLNAAVETCEIVRKLTPDAFLIVGGPHATVLPEDTLERTGADIVYAGEGEIAFERFLSGEDFKDIPGACYMKDGTIHRNEGLLVTEDLDTILIPDRSIFEMDNYFDTWYSMDRVDPSLRGTSIMATRGCPFKCTFCQPTLSEIFGKKIRKRSPESIIEELKYLKTAYNINAFMFEDSTFILDKKWVHEICDSMIKEELNLKWCCNVRADLLTVELIDHMKEAGLSKINMGVESASQRVLDDIYHKGITINGVRNALRLAKEREIFVQGYFMLGAPGETVEEMKMTIKFAASEPFDDALFDITTPFPHTEIWEQTKELINRDYSDFDCFHTSVYTLEGITPEGIERMKKMAFWKFYMHPSRIFTTLKTLLGPKYLKRTLLKARRV